MKNQYGECDCKLDKEVWRGNGGFGFIFQFWVRGMGGMAVGVQNPLVLKLK